MPFEAHFASELPDFQVVSSMPGVDGFTLKVDALYKVIVGSFDNLLAMRPFSLLVNLPYTPKLSLSPLDQSKDKIL